MNTTTNKAYRNTMLLRKESLRLYNYCSNNPVRYVDPTGQWIDNHDGTFTAEKGDTLWAKYGKDWYEKSGYTGNPEKLQVGEIVGKQLCKWKKEISNRGVDLNFFPVEENIHNYANLVDNPDNYFVIGGHGSTRIFEDKDKNKITPELLAELVKNNPNYTSGMCIILASCNLGGKTSGYINYAQRFANAMGENIKVFAATEKCWYYPDGTVKVAGDSPFFKGNPSLILRRGTFKCFLAQ